MSRLQQEIKIFEDSVQIKEERKPIIRAIRNTICALQNSGGGTLKLTCDQDTPNLADDILRPVEELFREAWTTMGTQKNCKIREQTARSLTLDIQGSSSLVTLNYNLFLPTETQVLQVRPIESSSEVRRMIERKIVEVNEDEAPQDFILGRSCGLRESQTVQFKSLKAEAEGYTFYGRVIRNNLAHYVSAFANHRGGRIYYGISDEGVVEGEEIGNEDQNTLREKIVSKIKKMKCGSPGRSLEDVEVTVDFKPVAMESTSKTTKFVMVVFIPPCLGGVFAADPESYYIDRNNRMQKIKFDDWLKYFRVPVQLWPIIFIPDPHIPRIDWSTPEQRKIYLDFTTKLVQCRNDNNAKAFRVLERLADDERYNRSGAPLVVKAEKVAVEYKKGNFARATSLLDRFSGFIENADDSEFHKVKFLYLRSRIERARGNYKESYKIAQRFINMRIEKIPAEFITVWFYMHLAMLANILAIKERATNSVKEEKFDTARKMLSLAMTDASTLSDVPNGFPDLRQKLQIYQAMVLLRCSLTGQVSAELVTREDIDRATKALCEVHSSYMNGELLTRYREIQLLFGQSCVFLRRSELSKKQNERKYLRSRALKLTKEAEDIARECDFQDMVEYANKFQQLI